MKKNVISLLYRSAAPAFLAFIIILGSATDKLFAADSFTPTIEFVDCFHNPPESSTTTCGYLEVLEDHNKPNGKTIKDYVVIFKAIDKKHDDPIIFLTGGPGSSTKDAVAAFEFTEGPFRQTMGLNRDIILLDQRGTNMSLPDLYCEEVGELRDQVYEISYRDAAKMRVKALMACNRRLKREGIDLSAYDTIEIASDIKDLRDALGVDKINLYGASYGTRLVMIAMRQFPEIIRSVLIDSVLSPEVNPFLEEMPGTMFSFGSFFEAAKSQYPKIGKWFNEIIARLEKNPVVVEGNHYDKDGVPIDSFDVTVNGVKFVNYVYFTLRDTPYKTWLPQVISDMFHTADYKKVADQWLAYLDTFFPVGGAEGTAQCLGMYSSVFAANDAHYTNPAQIKEFARKYTKNQSILSWYETSFIYVEPSVLKLWRVDPLPISVRDPLVSDIPTLMFVGTLDPATPANSNKGSSVALSNSFYFEILSGHAATFLPCAVDIGSDFFNDTEVKPVNNCETTYTWD